VGKSVIQVLLWEHQISGGGGLQLFSSLFGDISVVHQVKRTTVVEYSIVIRKAVDGMMISQFAMLVY